MDLLGGVDAGSVSEGPSQPAYAENDVWRSQKTAFANDIPVAKSTRTCAEALLNLVGFEFMFAWSCSGFLLSSVECFRVHEGRDAGKLCLQADSVRQRSQSFLSHQVSANEIL
jgi:hypothetical protein